MSDLLAQYAESRECLSCEREWVQTAWACPACGGPTDVYKQEGERLRVWGKMLQTHLEGMLSQNEDVVQSPTFQQLYEAAHYMQLEGERQITNENSKPFTLIFGSKQAKR